MIRLNVTLSAMVMQPEYGFDSPHVKVVILDDPVYVI